VASGPDSEKAFRDLGARIQTSPESISYGSQNACGEAHHQKYLVRRDIENARAQ
jgi:hypothetical protein